MLDGEHIPASALTLHWPRINKGELKDVAREMEMLATLL